MQSPLRQRVSALAFLLLVLSASMAGTSRAANAVVFHLTLDGVINPVKARYVKQALERARSEHATLVLVSIDTPGGLVRSMEDIVAGITNSPVPVVGFVAPRPAEATSAGAFILLATDVAVMAPGTRVGAAHPVGPEGPLQGAVDDKATNSLVSLAKSLALRRGRSEKAAEAMVRKSESYTAEEAKREGVIDLVVAGTSDLLQKLDGHELAFDDRKLTLSTRGASRIDVPLSVTGRILDKLADPTLASILLTIGVLGILYELATPGVAMGGIVGVTCLILGLLSMSVLPMSLAGALLLAAGAAAIAVEIKVQAHGMVGFAGLIAMVLGAVTLVDETRYFGAAPKVNLWVFLPIVAILGLGLLALVVVAARTLRAPPQSGVEALRGARGVAKTAFESVDGRFTGDVFADGARWSGIAHAPIAEGAEIEVIEVLRHPTRLEVRPIERGEEERT